MLDHEFDMAGQHFGKAENCPPAGWMMSQDAIATDIPGHEQLGCPDIERDEKPADSCTRHVDLAVRGQAPHVRHVQCERDQLVGTHSAHRFSPSFPAIVAQARCRRPAPLVVEPQRKLALATFPRVPLPQARRLIARRTRMSDRREIVRLTALASCAG